ncbi:DUF3306 domain-containing protein [Roseobacter sinensis]|uniref:DUF3306 domain-containing protein n=1 Tax=Roseobacter sinensis TaxID=2931391 RepID=A0ABT3BHP3_9RHOB|nr:DUF3306 domain-containing protein [Roseobacter sp. WL0113]MCV3273096.1 DUF3306 domain-containing protein [Roseobacter sp. WL0113]
MSAPSTFWARRRAAVEAEAQAEARAQIEAVAAARQAELAEKDDAEVLQEMGLPDPDAMQPGDDFAAFMAREVPEHLRNKALRKLWRSNPVLACVDGLNEYDDDFRAAMLAGGPVQTAYQVGKGMMAHIEEMARQAEQPARTEEVTEDAPDVATADAAAEEDVTPEPQPAMPAGEEVAEAPNAPRRMRFHFEEEAT